MGFERITVDSDVMGGQPCVRDTRIPVIAIVGMVESNAMTMKQILDDFPELESDDVLEALDYADQMGIGNSQPTRE